MKADAQINNVVYEEALLDTRYTCYINISEKMAETITSDPRTWPTVTSSGGKPRHG